jgi:hypothetical protein
MDRLDAAIRAENDPDMYAVFPLDIRRLTQTEPVGLITIAQGMEINVDGIRLTANKRLTAPEISAMADNIIADHRQRLDINFHPESFGEVLIAIFQKRIAALRGQLRKRPTSKKSKQSSKRSFKRSKSNSRKVRLGKRRI